MSFAEHPLFVFVYRIGRDESQVATVEPDPTVADPRASAISVFRSHYGDHAEIKRIYEHRIVNGTKTHRDVTEED